MLQGLSTQARRDILLDIADALEKNEKEILNENKSDVSAATEAGYDKALISRLTLKHDKASFFPFCLRTMIPSSVCFSIWSSYSS